MRAWIRLLAFALAADGARAAAPQPPDSGSAPALLSGADLMRRGNDLYNRGEFAKALLLYQRAEKRGADPAAVFFNQGNCLFRMNRFAPAAARFKESVRWSGGRFLPAQLNLAAVLFRLGEYGETVAAYRRALKDDPQNLSAWLYLADAYERTRDYVGALQAMEKARGLDPDDPALVYQTAEIHAALGETDRAVALVREAILRKPAEADFLFYVGDLHRQGGKPGDAAAAYREGLALREHDADALYKLADALAEDGKPFLAMDYLQRALAAKADFTDAAVFLGNLAFDAKWWDRCESAYRQALEHGNREGAEGLRNLAFEFHRQGRAGEAAGILERALALRPRDADLRAEAAQYREAAETKKPR